MILPTLSEESPLPRKRADERIRRDRFGSPDGLQPSQSQHAVLGEGPLCQCEVCLAAGRLAAAGHPRARARDRYSWPDQRPAVPTVPWVMDYGGRKLITSPIAATRPCVVVFRPTARGAAELEPDLSQPTANIP